MRFNTKPISMNRLPLLFVVFTLTSCIPVKIAPKFKNQDYKIMQAKKFKRKLHRETSFIFKDPKNDGEFYDYINNKYNLKDNYVGLNSPIIIKGETYYITYSEANKDDKTFNIIPMVIDEALNTDALSNVYETRKGHWYILITVYDNNLKNCLLDKHPKRKLIETYLKNLKAEYLATGNYKELLFKK